MEKIMEKKSCKSCQSTFTVTDADLAFYDKVSPIFSGKKYSISTPTLCPDCRQQRRLAFRNERKLYKRKCDLTWKDIISIYSPDKPYKVYDPKIWRSDQRNPMDYWRDFDFGKSFFEQFNEFLLAVPREGIIILNSENCDYNNMIRFSKDCYLCSLIANSERLYYSYWIVDESSDLIDCAYCFACTNCYECLNLDKCYDCTYVLDSSNSESCYFSYNLNGCKNCILCSNLVNKSYCINNKQYTPEEFAAMKKGIFVNGTALRNFINNFYDLLKKSIRKENTNIQTENSLGDYLKRCKDCAYSFDGENGENLKYVISFGNSKDSMDCYAIGFQDTARCYESAIAKWNSKIFFSFNNTNCDNIYYCDSNIACQNCFGCVGLRNKSYCIFNKEHTESEYKQLVPKIIEHMIITKERGEFFPWSLSPFGYNETVVMEYFPLTREEALAKWFKRSDYEAPFPKTDAKDIIICEVSRRPFRLIPQEIEFYKKHNLPLPTKHPDIRHAERMKLRNPRKLRDRKCAKCSADIKTTYSPERPEIVYCESCYNKEIYW